jgi:hypothetical protein
MKSMPDPGWDAEKSDPEMAEVPFWLAAFV